MERLNKILVLFFLSTVVCALPIIVFSQDPHLFQDDRKVLVIDFSGLNAKRNTDFRPEIFKQTLMPDGKIVSIGIHGIIPDSWRKKEGYNAIVSLKTSEKSAQDVYQFIKSDKTIIHFDINELLVPKQLPRIGDKTKGPAYVASNVAKKWIQQNPDGLLVLRGHSDGTWAVFHIYNHLQEKGISPQVLILESPRQVFNRWATRAIDNPGSLFLSITYDRDFPRETIIDEGYGNVPSPNWVNINITKENLKTESGLLWPQDVEAHGLFWKYDAEVKTLVQNKFTGVRGNPQTGKLRDVIIREIANFIRDNNFKNKNINNSEFSSYHTYEDQKRKIYSSIFPPQPPPPPGGAANPGGVVGYINGEEKIDETGRIIEEGFSAKEAIQNELSKSVFTEYPILSSVSHDKKRTQGENWNAVNQDESWEAAFVYRPPKIRRHIALSVHQLQKSLRNDSDIKPETSLPITRIRGITYDDTGDIILLGVEEDGDGVEKICPDDIALAMRCMWRSNESPGMSIDPRPDDNNAFKIGPMQDVVYFGGIKDTRVGVYAFNCDYWLKRLGAGKISVSLKGFKRYCDLALEAPEFKPASNRFWFYPKKNEFVVSPQRDIMLLNNSGVDILTEEQHYLFNKYRYHDVYRNIDPIAKDFADQLTNRYNELCVEYPDLARLRNFFALCEIFKWVEASGVKSGIIKLEKWKYLLHDYQPVPHHTTPIVKTVETSFVKGNFLMMIIGGVSCEIRIPEKPTIDKSGLLISLMNIVFSRRRPEDLYWVFRSKKEEEKKEALLKKRVKDSKKASRILKKGIVIDLYVTDEGLVNFNICDNGNVYEKDQEVAKEFKDLLDKTSKTKGKLGTTLLDQWEKFYMANLVQFSRSKPWITPDGKEVLLKPLLIIKSSESNYKYSNIEKVPVIRDNFITFIAYKRTKAESILEPSAVDLVEKIANIPKFTKENTVFAIRLPQMSELMQEEWKESISELEKIVNSRNVSFNPNIEKFDKMLHNSQKEIIVIDFTHTDRGIMLKNNERYTSKDILEGNGLTHIKYLVSGLGTCNLARLEKGKFVAALREKGVGITNATYNEVSSEIALKRFRQLIEIFKYIEQYNLPAYYILDIIDQLQEISEKGTTNLGKLDQGTYYLFG